MEPLRDHMRVYLSKDVVAEANDDDNDYPVVTILRRKQRLARPHFPTYRLNVMQASFDTSPATVTYWDTMESIHFGNIGWQGMALRLSPYVDGDQSHKVGCLRILQQLFPAYHATIKDILVEEVLAELRRSAKLHSSN